MPGLIRAYNEATNTPNTDTGGYHETITLASLRAARFMLAAHPDTGLSDVLAALMARASSASPAGCWRTGGRKRCSRWRRGARGWSRMCRHCRFERP
jgi:hypothetical protein